MSHYWNMTGNIQMSRELTGDEFQEIADEYNFEFNKGVITWEDNEGNHLPSQIDDLIKDLKDNYGITCKSAGGTYHAEDSMSGEWELVNDEIVVEEYDKIVEVLRAKVESLQEHVKMLQELVTEGYPQKGESPIDYYGRMHIYSGE